MLSIVIVSYNCLDILKRCLDSIFQFNDIGEELEVIVVDNSDNFETVECLKVTYRDVVCIKNINRGFGEANNVGAKVASGEYLLFLNPDTLIISPFFSRILKEFEIKKRLCFGVQLLDKKQNRTTSFGLIHPLGFKGVFLGKLFQFFNIFVPSKMFISGADIFIKKQLFFDINMFDESVFMYFEESDLFIRLLSKKIKGSFLKKYKIVHLEGGASSGDNLKKYQMQIHSYISVCNKNGINLKKQLLKELRYRKIILKISSLFRQKDKRNNYFAICSFLEEKIDEVLNA